MKKNYRLSGYYPGYPTGTGTVLGPGTSTSTHPVALLYYLAWYDTVITTPSPGHPHLTRYRNQQLEKFLATWQHHRTATPTICPCLRTAYSRHGHTLSRSGHMATREGLGEQEVSQPTTLTTMISVMTLTTNSTKKKARERLKKQHQQQQQQRRRRRRQQQQVQDDETKRQGKKLV